MTLDYEPAEQDGYSYRATEVVPEGQTPHRTPSDTSGTSDAYRSTLTIRFRGTEEPDPT